MSEADLHREIIKALNKLPDTYAFKVHGNMYQTKGISDVLVCHKGKFVALEVKLPARVSTTTPSQVHFLHKVRTARGAAAVVTSVQQALEVINGDAH